MRRTFTKVFPRLLTLAVVFAIPMFANAQLTPASYTFSTGTTASLEADANSNVIDMTVGAVQHIGPSSAIGAASGLLPFPFPYTFLSESVTTFSCGVNGITGLNNNVIPGNNIVGGTGNRIGTFVTGLSNAITHSTGYVRSKVVGTAPIRCFVIEWRNVSMNNTSTTPDGSWQLRFYETTNAIEMVYGDMNWGAGSSTSVRTGFSTSSTVYNQVSHSTHTNSTTTSLSNSYTTAGPIAALNGGGTATTRRFYRFDGPSTTLGTVTGAQVTGNVLSGSQNSPILRLAVNVGGLNNSTPFSVNEIVASTNGSGALTNISNAKLFFTGADATFNNPSQFGSTINNPSGNITFTGTRSLNAGLNYFWLTYDINSSATAGDSIDGEFVSIQIDSNPATITNSAPAGNRIITSPFVAGTYSIGSGGDFPNLRIPFNLINNSGLNGNVVFEIISDVTDTAAAVIGQWAEIGSGNYTMIIRPVGGPKTYSANVPSSGVIALVGADRVTIDGRISGSGRNLTIENLNTTSLNTAILLAGQTTIAGGCNDVTIRNSILRTGTIGSSVAASVAIQAQGTGAPNNNLLITENVIERAYTGVLISPAAPLSRNLNLVISNNILGSSDTSFRINLRSIDVRQSEGAIIEGNLIQNQITFNGATIAGIDVSTNNNALIIRNNIIKELRNLNTSGWGAYGISLAGGDGHQVYNNEISGVGTVNYTIGQTFSAQGIRITSGINHLIAYNTVRIDGNYTNTNQTPVVASGAPLTLTNSTVAAIVRNNIFINNIITNATGNKILPIVWLPTGYNFANLTMDNNVLFHSGEAYHTVGQVGTTFNVGVSVDLATWRTNSGKDANSVFEDPIFAGSTFVPSNAAVNNIGVPIAGITTDITGAVRSTTSPDPGAYEFVPPVIPNLLGAFNLVTPANNSIVNVSGPSVNTIDINWTTSVNGGAGTVSYQWRVDTLGGNFRPGLVSINSNNSGADTVLTLSLGQIDGLLASLGVAIGDTATVSWNVRAFSNPNDTFAINGPYTISLVRGVVQFPYCTPTVTNTVDTDLGRFTFGSLVNGSATPITNNPASTGQYSNFDTLPPISFAQGVTYPFVIDQITSGATFYVAFGYIYIDFNQNGVFETNELVFSGGPTGPTSTTPATTSISGNINIPISATLGTTRLRVILREGGTLNPPQDPCGTIGWGEIEDYLITVIPSPACVPAAGLATSNIASNSATISWGITPPSIGSQVEFGLTGFTQGTGTLIAVTDTFANLTGLVPQSTYQAYVRNICAIGDTSLWTGPVSFTTSCATFPLSFIETFESSSISLPCWTLGAGWATQPVSGFGVGSQSIRYNFYSIPAGTRADVLSATFAPTPSGHRLSFDHAYATFATEVDSLIIYTSTNNGSSWNLLIGLAGGTTGPLNTFGGTGATGLVNFVPTSAQWSTFNIPIPAGVNRVRFEAVSNFGNNLFIDNVKVEPLPSCIVPTGLSSSSITNTTATLNWTTTAANSQVQWGLSGFALGTGTIVNVPGTTTNLTGLAGNTAYQFYVRSICAVGDTSSWSGPASFTTPCNPLSVPYIQNFDSVTAPALPACFTTVSNGGSPWTNLNGNNASPSPIIFPSAPNAMISFFDSTQPKNDWFFTAPITLNSGATYSLKFQFRGQGFEGVGERLRATLSTTASPTTVIDTVWERVNLIMTAFEQADTNFTVSATGTYYVGFHAFSVADLDFIAVDNIIVDVVTGLGASKTLSGLSLFPNPSTGVFNLKFENALSNAAISITDLTGKVVMEKNLHGDGGMVDTTIDLSPFAQGMYFARIINGDAIQTIKLKKD